MSSSIFANLAAKKSLKQFLGSNDSTRDYLSSNIVPVNILFSGRINGGIAKGKITQMSADSSLGKTMIGMALLKQAQREGMHCVVIDSEHTWDAKNAKVNGIDISEDKLMVFDTADITAIKDVFTSLYVEKEDSHGRFIYYPMEDRKNIFVLFDSWGALMTNTQTSKAMEGSTTADMGGSTKEKNQLANAMSESRCTIFVVNHVISNLGGFGDPLAVPGGKKIYFVSDGIGMAMSAAKSKDGEETEMDKITGGVKGKIVTCVIKKGRTARESKKIKFRINYEDTGSGGGIDQWFGLLDLAMEHGCVVKGKDGYERPGIENEDSLWDDWSHEKKGKQYKDIYCKEFWLPLFKNTDFGDFLEKAFAFSSEDDLATSKTDIAAEFEEFVGKKAEDAKPKKKAKKFKDDDE